MTYRVPLHSKLAEETETQHTDANFGIARLASQSQNLPDHSGTQTLAQALYYCYPSQIQGGENYPQALQGRQQANATFHRHDRPDSSQASAMRSISEN